MPDVRHALDSHGDESQTGVAKTLSELARELRAEKSMPDLLERIVKVAVTEIDGAEHCGVSLVDGSSIRAVAATSPIVEAPRPSAERSQRGAVSQFAA